jgi:5-methylthioadenosine/S-adenosylhomocysteine deaminase
MLTVDPVSGDLPEGDVLIEDRKIAATAPEIRATNEWAVPHAVPNPAYTRRVRSEHFPSEDGLVTMAMALHGSQFATMEVTEHDRQSARDTGIRIPVQVGDGERGKSRPVARVHDKELLQPHTTNVHCKALAEDELKVIAETGGTASASANVGPHMGHGWPATGPLVAAGVSVGPSIDVCMANGGDTFGTMRNAISTQHGLDHDAAAEKASEPLEDLRLTCQDVSMFAAIVGARACGIDQNMGTLALGKEADLILLEADDLALTPMNNLAGAVYTAHPGPVDSLFVAGRAPKKSHGKPLGIDTARVCRQATESRGFTLACAADDPRSSGAGE